MFMNESLYDSSSILGSETEFIRQQEHELETGKPRMLRWKSGKRVDSRLITVLESFKELYLEQRELFKRSFPSLQDEFIDVFKKIGAASPKKAATLQRSLSIGSPRLARRGVDDSELRLDRFKVRTPGVGSVNSGGKPDQQLQSK